MLNYTQYRIRNNSQDHGPDNLPLRSACRVVVCTRLRCEQAQCATGEYWNPVQFTQTSNWERKTVFVSRTV